LSQRILNELATAKVGLLNATRKAVYDERLRAELAPPASFPRQVAESAAAETAHARPRAEPPPVQPPFAMATIPLHPIVRPPAPPTRIAVPAPPHSRHRLPATAMVQPDDEIPASRAGAHYARRLRGRSTFLRRSVAAFATGIMVGLVAWATWRNSDTRGTPGKTIADQEPRESAPPKDLQNRPLLSDHLN